MGIFSESRLAFHNEKAKQQQHRNNNLDNCFACALIELPLKTLFRAQEPVPQDAECLPSPPIKIPFLYGKLKDLVKGFAPGQHKQQKEPQERPCTQCSMGFFHRGNRRSTGDSDSKNSCRSFRSMRTVYSRMVSPTGSACNLRNSPSVDSPTTPRTPSGGSSVSYPATLIMPPFPPPSPSCSHISSGGVCEECADTAMACERWISGVEETGSAYEQELLESEPTPEIPPATTYEGQKSPLLGEREERPPTGLGIEMPSAIYEEQSSLLANPSSPPLTPPPAPKRRKERPAPVLTTCNPRRRISCGLERNCDTASATITLSSKHTGATFAPAPVQNVSKGRSTFEGFREMSCTLEHCGIHGGDWNLSTTAATIVGSSRDSSTTLAASLHSQSEDRRPAYQTDFREMVLYASKYYGRWKHGGDRGTAAATMIGSKRDSGATLAASMHSGSEDRPEYKQHPKGMYCAPKHYERCQVGAENRLGLTENKRRVSRIVDGLVTALTKGISWLREKGWRR